MEYYNPDTKETLSYKEVCSFYNTSFPIASEVLAETWYKIHETDLPPRKTDTVLSPEK